MTQPRRRAASAALALASMCLLIPGVRGQESLEVVGNLHDMVDAYLHARAKDLLAQRAATVAKITTPAALRARQDWIRERLRAALGGFPARTPLNPRITRTLDRRDYRVEMLRFESLPRFYVTANVYVPTTAAPPFPAVLGVAGHSDNGKASATYQQAWISLARRGFLVLALDPPGQGERAQYFDPALGRSRVGLGVPEHNLVGLQCLLTGSHFARYEIWDGMRAMDYLATRSDVDMARVAVAGNSGGGTQAAYLAVLEPRLAAVVSSCYMTSWETLWSNPGPQDSEQNIPDFLADGLDFADFAIAFAPRPFTILSAERDYFPIAGARSTHAEARRAYGLLGQPDRAGFFAHDDEHGWTRPRREATYRWLARWLQGREDRGVEPRITTELESNLYVTPTGQVATAYPDAETVQSLNLKDAERTFARRRAAGIEGPDALRRLVATRLRMATSPAERTAPRWTPQGRVAREGYRINKIVLHPEPGIQVPGLVFVPGGVEGRKPAILYLSAEGKARDAGPGGDIERLVRAGHVVLAPDPRGSGESRPRAGHGGYSPIWQTFQRALLVGRTLAGMQVEDALAAWDVLRARDDVDPARVAVLGKGQGAVIGLYTAVLEPRVQKVALESTVLSYREIARATLHENLTEIVVPGVLEDFDLPDLAAALAPRALAIVDPRSPTGSLIGVEAARDEFAPALRAYATSAAKPALHIGHRPEGWDVTTVYGDWLGVR